MATKKSERNLRKVPTKAKITLDDLPNHQVVTIAVYLCGGESRVVDTEDVAVRANELAPERFTWRKYPEQISLEHIRVYLSDAKKPKNGALLIGSGDEGWMLTSAGASFTRTQVDIVGSAVVGRRRLSNEEKRWRSRERARLLESTTTQKVMEGRIDDVTQREAEQFFRLDDYVVGAARERKISRLMNLLGDDEQLGTVIKAVAGILPGEKKG